MLGQFDFSDSFLKRNRFFPPKKNFINVPRGLMLRLYQLPYLTKSALWDLNWVYFCLLWRTSMLQENPIQIEHPFLCNIKIEIFPCLVIFTVFLDSRTYTRYQCWSWSATLSPNMQCSGSVGFVRYVFGPPGSASGSVSHKYGSGSFPFLIKVLSGQK